MAWSFWCLAPMKAPTRGCVINAKDVHFTQKISNYLGTLCQLLQSSGNYKDLRSSFRNWDQRLDIRTKDSLSIPIYKSFRSSQVLGTDNYIYIYIYMCVCVCVCVYIAIFILSVQFSSVAKSCPTLCDPMNCSTPGLPVHH